MLDVPLTDLCRVAQRVCTPPKVGLGWREVVRATKLVRHSSKRQIHVSYSQMSSNFNFY